MYIIKNILALKQEPEEEYIQLKTKKYKRRGTLICPVDNTLTKITQMTIGDMENDSKE